MQKKKIAHAHGFLRDAFDEVLDSARWEGLPERVQVGWEEQEISLLDLCEALRDSTDIIPGPFRRDAESILGDDAEIWTYGDAATLLAEQLQ